MNIYVETNFILELVFQQEQHEHCENILQFCEAGKASLLLPAYCLAEPHEKLIRQRNARLELQRLLDTEVRQLTRTAAYTVRINNIEKLSQLITESNYDERQRLIQYRDRLLKITEIIPLTVDVLNAAAQCENLYKLAPQDALVFASVAAHLNQQSVAESCFLNRNSRDFDAPEIHAELKRHKCKMIASFELGVQYIQAKGTE